MVQASMQAAQAEKARTDAMNGTAAATKGASTSTAALIDAQTRQMAASSASVRTLKDAEAAMATLGKSSATMAEVDGAMAAMNRAVAAGVVGQTELAAATDRADKIKLVDIAATKADTDATNKNTVAKGLNARSGTELSRVIGDLATGNMRRA